MDIEKQEKNTTTKPLTKNKQMELQQIFETTKEQRTEFTY
jgi:hypothetical protein